MSSNWPSPSHNYVPEYQQSGIPYVTSSANNEVTTTPVQITFPYITRWVQIFNTDGTANDTLRVGFTQHGVNATETANYLVLSGGQSTDRLEIKCTDLWFKQHGSSAASFSVIAGLTNISTSSITTITGSNGYVGVG